MSENDFKICRKVVYSGRVQGVGFRYTTSRIARNYQVTGSVRNQADGTVELIAFGQIDVVNQFLAHIAEHFGSHIDDVTANDLPSEKSFNGFTILR